MQVQVIAYIHRLLMSYPDSGGSNILSVLGKRVEDYKVLSKKFKRYLKELNNDNETNDFILRVGEKVLKRAEDVLNSIDYKNYFSMINRSMVRNELVLGRVDSSNLRVLESVEIGDLKKISYNLVEDDLIEYILKLRKKGYVFSEDIIINKFIIASRLDDSSGEYIRNLIEFPIDTLKVIEKYRLNKKGLSDSEYLKIIKNEYNWEFKGDD
ncbi:MAG: hypothetical protein ACRC2K_12775 [Clostridium sp.]